MELLRELRVQDHIAEATLAAVGDFGNAGDVADRLLFRRSVV